MVRVLELRGDLKRTPGIACRDRIGLRRKEVGGLSTPQGVGRLGLKEVVDAGRTAADLPFLGLEELQLGCDLMPWAWARWQAS
jgi:hypothetical protein